MNDLQQQFPISTTQVGDSLTPTINARSLHKYLQVKRDFTNWIKGRIGKYLFIENQDFIIFRQNGRKTNQAENKDGRGRPTSEYHITLDMAKELAMVENNERGRIARRYFINRDNQLRKVEQQAIATPNRLSEHEMQILAAITKNCRAMKYRTCDDDTLQYANGVLHNATDMLCREVGL